MSCTMSSMDLMRWFDGEASLECHTIEEHARACLHCQEQLERWKAQATWLSENVRAGAGDVVPLVGLEKVRARIAARESTAWERVVCGVADLWLFRRRAIAGVMLAVALGALAAPAVVWWLNAKGEPQMAAQETPSDVVPAAQKTDK